MKSRMTRVGQNLYRNAYGIYYGRRIISRRAKWKSFKTANRIQANSKLRAWLIELETKNTAGRDITIDALIDRFLATRTGLKTSTINLDKVLAKVFRQTFPSAIRVNQIKPSQMLTWLNTQETARAWNPTTFNRYRLFLRQLFDLAEADGIVTAVTSPFKAKFIKRRKRAKTERHIPTDAQFAAIIDSVRKERGNSGVNESADFLEFEGLAGLGQAEVSDLRLQDLQESGLPIKRRKTGEQFTVPIYPWLKPLFEKLRTRAMAKKIPEDARVFRVKNCAKALTNACCRLKLRRFTQRNLRQYCIARLAYAGVSARQTALWQGHADGGVLIQKIYRQVLSDDDLAMEAAELRKLGRAPDIVQFKSVA